MNMKADQFCYWLQGYFELAGANHVIADMDVATVHIIKNHLRLVAKVEPRHKNLFVDWLVLKLAAINTSATALLDSCRPVLSSEEVDAIRTHLANQFRHDIDNSYGGDKVELQAVHDGQEHNLFHQDSGGAYRC
jgi:hypothetical protein